MHKVSFLLKNTEEMGNIGCKEMAFECLGDSGGKKNFHCMPYGFIYVYVFFICIGIYIYNLKLKVNFN